ncbi:hypothetical protein KKH3_01250 [Pectobacterium actinidiae]|nr:hypothetical protein KKH3_01250 [Pectobacterium actinidiae]
MTHDYHNALPTAPQGKSRCGDFMAVTFSIFYFLSFGCGELTDALSD